VRALPPPRQSPGVWESETDEVFKMSSRQPALIDNLPEGLPPSGEKCGHERVAEIQCTRMLAAMVEEISERGVANVSVAHVVARSGVSRRTFYEIFEDREACLLAAFDDAIEKIEAVVGPAYERERVWQKKIRAALTALLEFLDREHATGRLVIVETLGAGPKALERRRGVLAPIIRAVDGGRREKGKREDPPLLTAEGVVGAVLSVLHARLSAWPLSSITDPSIKGGLDTSGALDMNGGQPGRLVELANEMMGIIVLPYLGPTAARRELQRPIPKPREIPQPSTSPDPLRELEMRLTYRTVRVLTAVASNPGSSNRTIGDTAGMPDQGQTSKLLARLHGLGLIENIGGGPVRGGPNAWTLTAKGWKVHAAISTDNSSGSKARAASAP
jgi:AcrR family transcriptional regulator